MAFIHKGACSIPPRQLALRAWSQSLSVSHRVVKAASLDCAGRLSSSASLGPALRLGGSKDQRRADRDICKLTTQP